jgi:hypothetical protein
MGRASTRFVPSGLSTRIDVTRASPPVERAGAIELHEGLHAGG